MNPTNHPTQQTDLDLTDTFARTLARTTAHLLHTASPIWYFNLLLFVINLGLNLGLKLWVGRQSGWAYAPFAEVLLMVITLFFLIRIRFDARLLKDIAQGDLALNHLDSALTQLKLRPAAALSRSMSERCLACMRLFYIFCGLTAVHVLMLLAQFFI